MTWSTQQLADLAATTVKAVRHYHKIGLLDVPDRTNNGYKQYQVAHLVRLLQIRRLTDLGVPLSKIMTMDESGQNLEATIQLLDADFEARIERMQQVRFELESILHHRAPVGVPSGFGAVAKVLSEADRALLLVYSCVLSDDALNDLREMLQHRDPLDDEFDALLPDANEDSIQNLAARYAPVIRRQEADYPWKARPLKYGPHGEAVAMNIVGQAILALYNPAQLQVRRRAHRIVKQVAEAAAHDDARWGGPDYSSSPSNSSEPVITMMTS